MIDTTVSRRSLIGAAGAAAAAGALAAGAPLTHAVAAEDAAASPAIPSFLVKPEPIVEFAQTHEHEIVVVGAGEAGLAAVHSAVAAGARVACVQNIDAPLSTGNMAACVDLEKTSPAGVQAAVSFINWKSDFRSNRDLVETWALNSQEALAWWAAASAEGGVESEPFDYSFTYNGYEMFFHANTYFHIDGAHNAACQVIAEQEAAAGCEFFYNMPAVQLQVAEDGSVTGVICRNADGAYELFCATKGVILATGDYSGNEEMRNYYCPDVKGFDMGTLVRDGSGLAMGMWAGACIVPPTHTKMIHGEPAPTRFEMPFLFLDNKGERFMDENCGGRMGYTNNYARRYIAQTGFENSMACKFWSIVPNNWEDYYEDWKAANPYEISVYNAYRRVDPEAWIKADTLEELCAAINAYIDEKEWGVDHIDEQVFVESVSRYNELCAAGADDDFGKDARYLVPIDSAPYYAVPRGSNGVPAILSGLVVDANSQCLNADMRPIAGLYAAGNAAGQFFGGVDYPMNIEGLSIGRAITSGYVLGGYVASL